MSPISKEVSRSNSQARGLGKGLSALIDTSKYDLSSKGYIPDLPVDQISSNPNQPRMVIRPEDLMGIADSIKDQGIIQPLIVTKRGDKDYVLIVGERRWRAAQLAGQDTVPVIVRDVSPREMLELAVIENVHRQDLNPLEEALAYKQLADQFNMTHKEIGKKVGYSRVAIVNKIRILKLPDSIKQLVLDSAITEGHARALLGLTDEAAQLAVANLAISKKLSVHQTEEVVRRVVQGTDTPTREHRRLSPRAQDIEKRLGSCLNSRIKLQRLKTGGKIIIRYKDADDLERIYSMIERSA